MGITRTQLINKVKHRLGAPMVKVELCDEQIIDNIDYARQKFIKWAIGNATQEVYFTVLLQAGKRFYDLPAGVTEVVSYMDDPIKSGGINTLFTIDNFLFSGGYFGNMFMGGYDIVSYHLVMDFLTTLSKYRSSPYNWKYHKSTNQLEINPVPTAGKSPKPVTITNPDTGLLETMYVDSPGWVLLRTYMIQGATLANYTPDWYDVLKEKKTVVEQRFLTQEEKNNRRILLQHTPFNDTEQTDTSDSNMREDVLLLTEGKIQEQGTWWWFNSYNPRLIEWGDDMANYINSLDDDTQFNVSVSYPVVYNSEYYPDEWENVTSTSNEVEKFTLTESDVNNGRIQLRRPVWAENISFFVDGYAKQYGVDFIVDPNDNSIITWSDKYYHYTASIDDKIVVNYVTVSSMKPSNAGSMTQSVIKQYTTKMEHITLTADNITSKSFELVNTVSVGDGMKLTIGQSNKMYGLDYVIQNDRKTITWNFTGSTMTPIEGQTVTVTYTSATPIITEVEEDLYENDWIIDYVTALSKINLGIIRRKFASFNSMGNSGISLDGSELISEGKEEKTELEETLRLEEAHEGYGILVA